MSDSVAGAAVEYQNDEVTVYSDGTVHRAPFDPPPVPACPSPPHPSSQVASKDLPLNPSLSTSIRLFLPPSCASLPPPTSPPSSSKLPILLYFHGGAFIHCSTTIPEIHHYLCRLATHCNVLIVSVDYRLAPEHPFPAAYEDCFEGLVWLNKQAMHGASGEPWLAKYGDFSRCFMGGDSAGGTITHYVGMQALGYGSWKSHHEHKGLGYVSLKGLLVCHPYFTCRRGAVKKVPVSGELLKLYKYWKVGAEDPLLDPLSPAGPCLASAPLPRVFVCVAGLDAIKEGAIVYYESLVEAGKQAKLSVGEGENHVFHLIVPDSPNVIPLLDQMRDFINCCC